MWSRSTNTKNLSKRSFVAWKSIPATKSAPRDEDIAAFPWNALSSHTSEVVTAWLPIATTLQDKKADRNDLSQPLQRIRVVEVAPSTNTQTVEALPDTKKKASNLNGKPITKQWSTPPPEQPVGRRKSQSSEQSRKSALFWRKP